MTEKAKGVSLIWSEVVAKISAIYFVKVNPQPTGTSKKDMKGRIRQIMEEKKSHGKTIENIGTINKLMINDSKLRLEENKAKNGKIASWAERDIAIYCAIMLGMNFLKRLQNIG